MKQNELIKKLLASRMSLYPSAASTTEAVKYIEQCENPNQPQLFALLMLYHNALIDELIADLTSEDLATH